MHRYRGRGIRDAPLLPDFFFSRVPLRRHQSLRKKLRAQGRLSEFWRSHNLDMIGFSESCNAERGVNDPLINYLDVRFLRWKPGDTEGGCRDEGWDLQQGPTLRW